MYVQARFEGNMHGKMSNCPQYPAVAAAKQVTVQLLKKIASTARGNCAPVLGTWHS
jgi:hypothetical protein